MTRMPLFVAWLVAMLLAVGSVACRAQADDKGASEDASITQRVQRAIAKDAVLKGMDIKVETQHGVVNLTGFVRSLENIAKAGELANAVDGVVAVKNDLRVANRPSRA
jgi:hyperosmotically inducible protein